ncbi:MAG: hypothetical protein JNL72_12990 [Flavipsychrobacter sp.]|nr:hypothetical protein [Flavipsychrobacter sp.]
MSVYVIEGYSRYNINEYSKLFFKGEERAHTYMGSGLRFMILLSVLAVALMSVVLHVPGWVERLFHSGTDAVAQSHLHYCLLVMFVLACVHSIVKYLAYAVLPYGKVYIPERFGAVYAILEALLWLFAAMRLLSLFWVFFVYAAVLILVSLIFLRSMVKKYDFYQSIFRNGSLKEGVGQAKRSLSMVVNNFCEKFTVDGLNVIVSAFYSAFLVPVYAAKRTMSNLMVTGTNMMVATFTIEYQKHSVNKDGKSLFNLFNATWLLVGIIVNYGIVVFYSFLPDIFRIWTRGKLQMDISLFNYLLATGVFVVYGTNIVTYLKALNKVRLVFIVAVSRAILLLSLIMILPKKLENIGLSLLVTEWTVNIILLNVILYRELVAFHCEDIARKMFWNILPFLLTAGYLLTHAFFPLEPYLKMTITLVILTVVYYLQIMRVDNEALIVRLQVLKYRLTGGKRK